MTTDTLREEVIALRRRSLYAPLPMGVALVVAVMLGIAGGDPSWGVWIVLLAGGVPLWIAVARDARRRDATVLAKGDDVVRSYLRGRLDGQIVQTSRLVSAFIAIPFLLLGLVFLVGGTKHPARPLLAAEYFLVGAVLLVSVLHRRFRVRPALVRRRAELGEAPASPEPWLADVAREIAAAQGDTHAALFWHETTGVKMRDANVAVRNLPEPPPATVEAGAFSTAAADPGPPDDVVRARIRTLAWRDLAGHAITLAILAALFVTQNWAKGGTVHSIAREQWGELTIAQKAYAVIGAFTVLVAFAQRHLHRQALKGGASSVRAYYRRELERRLARVSKWSVAEKVFLGVAALFVVEAVIGIAGGTESHRGGGWPALAEALVFVVWFVVVPYATKRRRRPVLAREFAELIGAGEPPPVPPVA